jgi:hypothetical protein
MGSNTWHQQGKHDEHNGTTVAMANQGEHARDLEGAR